MRRVFSRPSQGIGHDTGPTDCDKEDTMRCTAVPILLLAVFGSEAAPAAPPGR